MTPLERALDILEELRSNIRNHESLEKILKETKKQVLNQYILFYNGTYAMKHDSFLLTGLNSGCSCLSTSGSDSIGRKRSLSLIRLHIQVSTGL